MGFRDIWNSIKDKVVSAGSAVVGAAESVKKKVGSVAGKTKNIILRRDEELQGVINNCVNELNELSIANRKGENDLLDDILGAFLTMIGDEKFTGFIDSHSGEKKGFAGFANFLRKQLNDANKIGNSNNESAIDEVRTKVLQVLSRVKKYSGISSRVKDFVGPCERLRREIISIGSNGEEVLEFDSYFDKACKHLSSAAAKKSNEKKGFCGSMYDAYDAVCKMCKYEKLGKKGEGDDEKKTASGKWYSKCDGKTTFNERIEAVLAICDDEYKSDRGFAKKYLKFKGQTKWQKLRKLADKATKNGMNIGALGLDAENKVIVNNNDDENTDNLSLNNTYTMKLDEQ